MSPDAPNDLDALRAEIDVLNAELAVALAQRMVVVDAIGALKAGAGVPLRDATRERAQTMAARSVAPSLTDAEVDRFFAVVFELALARMARRP